MGNEVLATILTAYFTWAFEKGIFPCTLKTTKVVPTLKTGNKNSVNNYRPISLLPSLSKVLEKLIKIRCVKFFDKYDILYDYQYGFREGHSVLHSLLDVTSFGNDSIQNKENIAMLLMDLRKAFDTVSHNILHQKLYHYGIRGPAHKLIESYLTSRKQFVSIDNVNSSAQSINIGIPQGSILGPLLFLIYINDLPNATFSKPRLFADDTCIMPSDSSLPNLETKCNTELNQLKNWCNTNKLQINPKKSSVLLIPSKLNSPPLNLKIYYDNSLIVCQELCKYLSMHLDSKLLFKNHIKQIEVKVAKGVGILSKLRFLFPKSTLLLLYYALVHPHLLYALPLWGCINQKYTQKLQLLQNKAIWVICNSNCFSSVTPLYFELGILKITELFKFEIAKTNAPTLS